MRRENFEDYPNRRLDAADITSMAKHTEDVARSVGLGANAEAGVLAGLSWSYDSGTRVFTFQPGVAVDAAGNIVRVRVATAASAVAPADVGVAGMYVWCAVQLGVTTAGAANRVKWVAANTENTASMYTYKEDSVSFVVAASQPPDTASGTSYFKVLAITWSGSTPSLTATRRWWSIPGLRSGVAEGCETDKAQFDTNFTLNNGILGNAVNILFGAVKKLAGGSYTARDVISSAWALSASALDVRIAILEAFKVFYYGARKFGVALAPVAQTGSGWAYTSAEWQTSNASESLTFEIQCPPGFFPETCKAIAQTGSSTTMSIALFRRDIGAGTTSSLGSASWSTSESGTKSVGTFDEDSDPTSNKFFVTVTTGGSGSSGNRLKQIYVEGYYPTS